MIHTPRERLNRFRRELDSLLAKRDRLDNAGMATDRLDRLIQAKQATLEKLEQVAAMLERLTTRRSA